MKKKRKKRSREDSDSDEVKGQERGLAKIQKYVTRNDPDKLEALLSKHRSHRKLLVRCENAFGETALHQACQAGHIELIRVLLRYGADASARDPAGNTPAHVAARRGFLDAVTELLQCSRPPDIDLTNDDGLSIHALVDRALGHHAAPQTHAGGAAGQAGRAGAGSESESEEAAWRRKLREADSEDEGGRGPDVYAGWGASWLGGSGSQAAALETEDEWADRMWAEMRQRTRAAAQQAQAAFTATRKAQLEQAAARAAEAAQRSANILEQERARDAAWRRAAGQGRLLQGPDAAGAPPATDPGAAYLSYEAGWAQLQQRLQRPPYLPQAVGPSARPAVAPLALQELPWPLPLHTLPEAGFTPELLQKVLLHGVQGPADIKRRMRAELLRWHPDKWRANIAPHVLPADLPRAEALVRGVAQALTQLMTGG